jgi:hypothetical protein
MTLQCEALCRSDSNTVGGSDSGTTSEQDSVGELPQRAGAGIQFPSSGQSDLKNLVSTRLRPSTARQAGDESDAPLMNRVRRMILSGELAPGQRVTEAGLADTNLGYGHLVKLITTSLAAARSSAWRTTRIVRRSHSPWMWPTRCGCSDPCSSAITAPRPLSPSAVYSASLRSIGTRLCLHERVVFVGSVRRCWIVSPSNIKL